MPHAPVVKVQLTTDFLQLEIFFFSLSTVLDWPWPLSKTENAFMDACNKMRQAALCAKIQTLQFISSLGWDPHGGRKNVNFCNLAFSVGSNYSSELLLWTWPLFSTQRAQMSVIRYWHFVLAAITLLDFYIEHDPCFQRNTHLCIL